MIATSESRKFALTAALCTRVLIQRSVPQCAYAYSAWRRGSQAIPCWPRRWLSTSAHTEYIGGGGYRGGITRPGAVRGVRVEGAKYSGNGYRAETAMCSSRQWHAAVHVSNGRKKGGRRVGGMLKSRRNRWREQKTEMIDAPETACICQERFGLSFSSFIWRKIFFLDYAIVTF
jgi:hypothetical protein